MKKPLNAQDELEKLFERKGSAIFEALLEVAKAYRLKKGTHEAFSDLTHLIHNTLTMANLMGRRRLLMEADYVRKTQGNFSDLANENPLGPLEFTEAVEDIVSREPRLAKSWREVSDLYSTEHVFALARSASENVTERLQKQIYRLLGQGESPAVIEKEIENIGKSAAMGEVRDWTRAYASNVMRTNAATGYSNGRFEQAEDPEVAEVIPAMMFSSLCDAFSRPWHCAADGMIAATNDPIWKRFKPPIGWQCRCAPIFQSRFELERKGLWKDGKPVAYYPPSFGQAHPDAGFKVGSFDFGATG